MNRWLYYIGFFVLSMSMLFLSACSDEAIPPDEQGSEEFEGDKEIPLMISLKDLQGVSTYGTNYPGEIRVPGSTWEDSIKNVTVYIFNQSYECEKIVTATSTPTAPEMVKTGTKHMVAVVNATGKITLPTVESTTDYNALLKMLTDASTDVPTSPFLMTGKAMNVSLPNELSSAAPYEINIDVERTVAKVKIKVMKSGFAQNANITLTRIFLYQGADRVALLEPQSINPISHNLSDTSNVFRHTTTLAPSGSVPNAGDGFCEMVDSFYTFESLCGVDKSKAVRIVLESYVNSPSNIRTAEFYLGTFVNAQGDSVFDVKRNYWYDVTVNIVKPGMDSINVRVVNCPWNTSEPQNEYPGSGFEFETAIPFKLVKNYTAADMAKAPATIAIDKHTKGASWIDLKATYGTPWTLKLRDNSARNQNVFVSINGTSWTPLVYGGTPLSGSGLDAFQRIYIYRPYVENNEPDKGPTLYVESGTSYIQDFVIQPREMTPVPTNCFILRPQLTGVPTNETRAYIPLAGVYSYWEDYLLANGDSIPGGYTTQIKAEIRFEENVNPGNIIKSKSVINDLKRDSAYLYVEAGAVQGNAVVDMRVNDITYWSFHIWVTDYNPNEAAGQKLFGGRIFMDRNLGALSNIYNNEGDARGMYYQYGRKDPFRRGGDWTNTYINCTPGSTSTAAGAQSTAMSSSVIRPLIAIPSSLNVPNMLLTRGGTANWSLLEENNYLWCTEGGNKTAFDPCPEGWRVPQQTSYGTSNSPWADASTEPFATGLVTNGRYHTTLGYYPYSGYIATLPIINTTTNAYYWSSWANFNTNPYQGTGLSISTSSVSSNPLIDMAYGASVRCVVDSK